LSSLAWTAAFARGRVAASTAAAELLPLVERHAAAVALLAAVAAAGVGVAHGTYAAAGADASGYVSEAALFASGRVVRDEPFARTVRWPDATWTMSPLGYRPGRQVGELVPTYPPGLALATAVATLIAGESGAYLVVPLLGALAVWCTYLLGVRLHSRPAGLVGAVLLATSPIFLFQVVQPMSDVAVAAWWALAFTLSLSPAKGGAALSSDSNRATISSATGRMAVWPARGPVALPSVVDDVAGSSRSAGAVVSSATNGDARSAATDVSASLACGATAGLAMLTRPNLLPLVLPLALLLAGMAAPVGRQTRGSSRLRRLAWFGVGLLPAVSALLLLNWRWYGAPFA